MGVKERRLREKENLREEILDAARELFVKEGYESVSMRKIAEKIEYSPTTIYLYFADKAELLYCLCQETFEQLRKSMEVLGQESNDPLSCLKKSMKIYIDFGLEHPNHYKVAFIIKPEHQENADLYLSEQSSGQKAYSCMRKVVEEGINQGQLRAGDVEATTQVIWAAIHGVTSLLITHTQFPWVEKNRLISLMIDTITDSLVQH